MERELSDSESSQLSDERNSPGESSQSFDRSEIHSSSQSNSQSSSSDSSDSDTDQDKIISLGKIICPRCDGEKFLTQA